MLSKLERSSSLLSSWKLDCFIETIFFFWLIEFFSSYSKSLSHCKCFQVTAVWEKLALKFLTFPPPSLPLFHFINSLLWPQAWFFFFFSFIFISWRLITLQYYSGFFHTLTLIIHGFTCIPHPDPPSHLPLDPIPLALPSAPGLSTCLMHPTWAGDLFHPR